MESYSRDALSLACSAFRSIHAVLFLAEHIQGMCTQYLYLVSCLWAFVWLLVGGGCVFSCCEHSCTRVCVNTFPFLMAKYPGVGITGWHADVCSSFYKKQLARFMDEEIKS